MPNSEVKYIAFLDILGFKDLVAKNGHAELVRKFNLILVTLELSLSQGKYVLSTSGDKAVADLNNARINCLTISDSVILWTDDSSMKSFVDLIVVLFQFMQGAFASGFPLRGALSVGELAILRGELSQSKIISRQTLLGQGLVSAYELESQQDWAGCIIDDIAIKHYLEAESKYADFPDLATLDYLIEKKIIVRYAVPMKSGPLDGLVVNWTLATSLPLTAEWLRKVFLMHNKSLDAPSANQKLINTLSFIEYLGQTE